MKKQKINRTNITKHLIEYQLAIINKTLVETFDDDNWYFNWTITRQQQKEFKKYAVPLLKKTFKFNNRKAYANFEWFYVQFGLRIKN